MTDEELIEELSEMGGHPCRAHLPMGERLRQASDRIEELREALREIASDDFGLQGLIEDGVYEETETSRYYAALVSWRRKRARAALERQP
jgi:hypothetical protein